MIEQLLMSPDAIKRAKAAPFYEQRIQILNKLRSKGYSVKTLYNFSKMLIHVANTIQSFSTDFVFSDNDIEKITEKSHLKGKKLFARTLKLLVQHVNRYKKYEHPMETEVRTAIHSFLKFKAHLSKATLDGYELTLKKFGFFLYANDIRFSNLDYREVDRFILSFRHWRPIAQRTQISRLINFLSFCEHNGLYVKKISTSIIRPHVWQYDTIPSALPWNAVEEARNTVSNPQSALRNKAIILLLSTYGFRSNEVRNLCLSDIDWENDIIHIYHTKTKKHSKYPLDVSVGNSIIEYILKERPQVESNFLFLGSKAPYSQLSRTGLCALIRRHFLKLGNCAGSKKGPHAIRHAVAQHMLNVNMPFKVIGDQLGHSSPASTYIYAKLDTLHLQKVAMDEINHLLIKNGSPQQTNENLHFVVMQNLEDVL